MVGGTSVVDLAEAGAGGEPAPGVTIRSNALSPTLLRLIVILDDDVGVGAEGVGSGGDREAWDDWPESRRTGRDDMGTAGSRARVGDDLRNG